MVALYKNMMNRSSFNFSLIKSFTFFFCCVGRKNKQSLKKPKNRNLRLLAQGQKKLKMDLDVVRLLDIIHGTEILYRVLFDMDQRLLLKF